MALSPQPSTWLLNSCALTQVTELHCNPSDMTMNRWHAGLQEIAHSLPIPESSTELQQVAQQHQADNSSGQPAGPAALCNLYPFTDVLDRRRQFAFDL